MLHKQNIADRYRDDLQFSPSLVFSHPFKLENSIVQNFQSFVMSHDIANARFTNAVFARRLGESDFGPIAQLHIMRHTKIGQLTPNSQHTLESFREIPLNLPLTT